jgi:hypothetical protein
MLANIVFIDPLHESQSSFAFRASSYRYMMLALPAVLLDRLLSLSNENSVITETVSRMSMRTLTRGENPSTSKAP